LSFLPNHHPQPVNLSPFSIINLLLGIVVSIFVSVKSRSSQGPNPGQVLKEEEKEQEAFIVLSFFPQTARNNCGELFCLPCDFIESRFPALRYQADSSGATNE
jgi:hypothetical protein